LTTRQGFAAFYCRNANILPLLTEFQSVCLYMVYIYMYIILHAKNRMQLVLVGNIIKGDNWIEEGWSGRKLEKTA
jgi:hypothetical protein